MTEIIPQPVYPDQPSPTALAQYPDRESLEGFFKTAENVAIRIGNGWEYLEGMANRVGQEGERFMQLYNAWCVMVAEYEFVVDTVDARVLGISYEEFQTIYKSPGGWDEQKFDRQTQVPAPRG